MRDGDFLQRGNQQSSIWIPEAAVGSHYTRHDPARDTVEHRGAVVGVPLVGGSLLHNELAMAIFFRGGSNNHPFGFQSYE